MSGLSLGPRPLWYVVTIAVSMNNTYVRRGSNNYVLLMQLDLLALGDLLEIGDAFGVGRPQVGQGKGDPADFEPLRGAEEGHGLGKLDQGVEKRALFKD